MPNALHCTKTLLSHQVIKQETDITSNSLACRIGSSLFKVPIPNDFQQVKSMTKLLIPKDNNKATSKTEILPPRIYTTTRPRRWQVKKHTSL
jgi:hypothetical protein